MADIDTIKNAITAAQTRAAIAILLPAIFQTENLFTDATINEWNLFKPLANTFALQFTPSTAFTSPLEFINWVSIHPEFAGSKQYLKHLADTINSHITHDQAEITKMVTWLDAMQTLNNASVVTIGGKFLD